MTEVQFEALLERKREEFRKERFCAGIISAMVANTSMARGEDSKVWSALDFVPEWNKQEEMKAIPKTDDEMIASMIRFFGTGPGKPN